MKRMILFILAIILCLPIASLATDVGGIIDSDTTWDLAGSPYNIASEVQIAEGATLTVAPGVIVDGTHGRIRVWGTLSAVGTDTQKITFLRTWIGPPQATSNAVINIQFADFIVGSIYCEYGFSLTLRDSRISGQQGLYDSRVRVKFPYNDCIIERNIFLYLNQVDLGDSKGDTKIVVKNNVFYDARVHNNQNYDNSEVLLQNNSFLSTDRVVLSLSIAPQNITATYNYWNTTETSVIDQMIWDRNDSLESGDYVVYACRVGPRQ
jgi:hypothetical protein